MATAAQTSSGIKSSSMPCPPPTPGLSGVIPALVVGAPLVVEPLVSVPSVVVPVVTVLALPAPPAALTTGACPRSAPELQAPASRGSNHTAQRNFSIMGLTFLSTSDTTQPPAGRSWYTDTNGTQLGGYYPWALRHSS